MTTTSRRNFLSATIATGVTALTAKSLLAEATSKPLPTNKPSATGHYRPAVRFGLGGVAIGNGFAPTTDEDAEGTLQAAWAAGVRYFDTSPWYGLGLSERRFGFFLHSHKPEEYVLSTKVGRLLTATAKPPENTMWKPPAPFAYRYDYTAAGVRRSIEDSLQRLGVSQIDVVFIHDLSPDNPDMLDRWPEYFQVAAKGAMPELTRMREEKLIKAWGFGVNRPEPALKAVEVADPDIFLLATQYSLLDHQEALDHTFPALEKRGISVVVGSPLNAGYLAGRDRYNYRGTIPSDAPAKRERMNAIATEHGVDLRTAALQFAATPTTVSAVIPGARTADQVNANAKSMQIAIPDDFWAAFKREGLIARNAPTPKAA